MTVDENIDLVGKWVDEIWNRSRLEQLSAFHPDSFDNEGHPTSLDEARPWHEDFRAAFPDIRYEVLDIFAAGDRVAVRWRATATHQGTLWNLIPATGKHVVWTGLHHLRISHGRIVEIWASQNTVSLLQQLGATLQPPEVL